MTVTDTQKVKTGELLPCVNLAFSKRHSGGPSLPVRPWSPANPYANRIAKRLASHGGKHRPSCVSDGRLFQEEEYAVAIMREIIELRGTTTGREAPF